MMDFMNIIYMLKRLIWAAFNSPSWENHHAFPKGKNDPDLLEMKSSTEVFDQEMGAEFTSLVVAYIMIFKAHSCGNYPYNSMLPVF